jgi:tetratricopeptide (TPR) repeat protein
MTDRRVAPVAAGGEDGPIGLLDVFISYSSKDADLAAALEKLLGQRGLNVWRDRTRLDQEAGKPYTPAIRNALDTARKVVVLWTPRAVASEWVKQEAAAALKHHKLVPLLLEPCELEFPHFLLQSITVGDIERAIDRICDVIHADVPSSGPVILPKRNGNSLPTSVTPNDLIGRDKELSDLFNSWDFGKTRIYVFDAMGGTGKTALINAFVQALEMFGWRDAERIYTWSFYRQGTREESNISSDEFLSDALETFGFSSRKSVAAMKSWEKGEALARLVAKSRTLLILDGVEQLQYPAHNPGLAGQIKQNDGLKELLEHLAQENKGLCLVTTRLPLVDLKKYTDSGVKCTPLQPLSTVHGVKLLRKLGVHGPHDELEHTVSGHADPTRGWPEGYDGHALSLTLLANYLRTVHGGDIRQRDKVPGLIGADRPQGGHAFRVMAAYEQHFESSIREQVAKGKMLEQTAARQLAICYLIGLFDRPAAADVMAFMRRSAIAGLTEPLANLTEGEWKFAVDDLRKLGLLNRPHTGKDGVVADDGSLDAHPLVRAYFEERLKARSGSRVCAAAHGRLYDFYRCEGLPPAFERPEAYWMLRVQQGMENELKRALDEMARAPPASLPSPFSTAGSARLKAAASLVGTDEFVKARRTFAPELGRDGTANEILAGMSSCLAAIAHGCKAGRDEEALHDIYIPRVLRGDKKFIVYELGAFGADLAALSNFFVEPFIKPAGRSELRPGGLNDGDQALVISFAGFALKGLGRLADSVESTRAAVAYHLRRQDWESAATDGGNLSEAMLTLGRVKEAVEAAKAAVDNADRLSRTVGAPSADKVAWVRKVAGATHANALAAAGRVVEANGLFEGAEALQAKHQEGVPLLHSLNGYWLCNLRLAQGRAREVLKRAEFDRNLDKGQKFALDVAVDNLVLGCAHAALAVAHNSATGGEGKGVPMGEDASQATRYLDDAAGALRLAGSKEHIANGFIARANWHRICGDHTFARDDLSKAFDIAEPSSMRLILVDAYLERARLALAMGDLGAAADDVIQARKIMDATGYARRMVDVQLVEAGIALHDDSDTAALRLTHAAQEIERGYWGSLDELAATYARSRIDDGSTLIRLKSARTRFDAAADAAFQAAWNRRET